MTKHILLPVFIFFSVVASSQEVMKIQDGAVLTIQAGAEVTVQGGVSFDNGSTVSNNGTFVIKQNTISGSSDFFDNTITRYSYGSGKFVFNSNAQQNIYSNNNFGRIDVDGADIVLQTDIIANKWWLANGKVNTGGYKAIVLGTAERDLEAASSNANFTNSWIAGSLRRYINPVVANSYLFPVSNGNNRNFVELGNLNAHPMNSVQYIDVSVASPKPGTDDGLMVTENGLQYVSVNNAAVWHIVPDNQTSGGKFDLKLFFEGFTDLTDNSFAILQRPDLSSNAAEWQVPAESNINPLGEDGRKLSDGYAMRKLVGVFGQFGIGTLLLNALPVELVNFNAQRLSKSTVQLSWQTVSESNNKGFDIERRYENETSFLSNGFIDTKALNGNSQSALSYQFTDNNNFGGITYYRIKQIDRDNRGTYSLIKAVKALDGSSVSVLLWPNPSNGQFSVQLAGIAGRKDILVTDVQGRLVKKISINGTQQVNVSGLKAGTYLVAIPNAFGNNQNFAEKIIVVR